MSISLIALEEHFLWTNLLNAGIYPEKNIANFPPAVVNMLQTVNESRIQNMDENNIAIQVLSHVPFNPPTEVVEATNDFLASTIESYPTRFAGFALLSMNDPVIAAAELERSVNELGLVGALVANTLDNGTFYDTPNFDPLWQKAVDLDVPLYLHPYFAPDDIQKALYEGPYSSEAQMGIATVCWGWHSMTGLHILRMFAAGVFERYPKLKFIVGHMGEMSPFMLNRILIYSQNWPEVVSRKRDFREVYDNNIWITTSGMFSLAPMSSVLRETKIDRVMFSVDYPFSQNEAGKDFFQQLKRSGLVDEEGLRQIGYKNAQALLKLKR